MHSALPLLMVLQAAPSTPAVEAILEGERVSYAEREQMAAVAATTLSRSGVSACETLEVAMRDLADLDQKLALQALMLDFNRDAATSNAGLLKAGADRLSAANTELAMTRGRFLYAYTVLCEWNRPAP